MGSSYKKGLPIGREKMKHIFIVGCKGIPTRYGGFETFVDKLTEYRKDESIKYHVACLKTKEEYEQEEKEFEYNNAHCFNIPARVNGSAKAIFYDIDAINYCVKYIKEHQIENPIIYVLACRIGPFIKGLKRKIKKVGGTLYVNPDGHEWKRAKWSGPVRKYWKISEKLMVKHAELLVCDSIGIEKYIQEDYKKYHPKTTFIAYGAETSPSKLANDEPKLLEWFGKFGIRSQEYYLIVGRFVPENNFELMIREFMKSKTKKDLVIITGYEGVSYYEELRQKTAFDQDARIKFVGTLYDQELLKKVRELAYGYLHGHSVGGTNPSLLEALGQTKLNLLFDVIFNREVGQEGALYFNQEDGNLAGLLEQADRMSTEEIEEMSQKAKERIDSYYSWEYIRDRYEELFR